VAIRIRCEAYQVDRVFREDLITIGRGPGNTLQLEHPKVSGIHGQVVRREGGYVFEDLGSRNGSLVKTEKGEVLLGAAKGRGAVALEGPTAQITLGDSQQPVRLEVSWEVASPADDLCLSVGRTIVSSRALIDAPGLASRLIGDSQVNRQRLEALLTLLPKLQRSLEPGTVAHLLIAAVLESIEGVEVAGIFFHTEKGMLPLLLRTRQSAEPLPIPWAKVKPLLEDVLEQRAALQLREDPKRLAQRLEVPGRKLESLLVSPLFDGDALEGVLLAAGPGQFDQRALDWLTLLAYQASFSLRNAYVSEVRRVQHGRLQDENSFLRESLEKAPQGQGAQLIGDSPALKKVLHQLHAVARTNTTVLILGETGTGKELIAKRVHQHSERAQAIFAAVNCGALTETLLESELFGHVRGAFTGAAKDKKGLLQVVDGGTLFLDEIGEVSPKLQVKLLRFLENGELSPVGSVRTQQVDVRIIAATNRDLQQEVTQGHFREDLYYRINVFPLNLPPLRERQGDIRLLAQHFLATFNDRFGKRVSGLSEQALGKLEQYAWPGNIRQLQNELERAILMADDDAELKPEDLSERISGMLEIPVAVGPLHEAMEKLEEQYIRRALKQHDYNRTRTAKTLGISRQALTAKLHKYDLLSLGKEDS
jgi:Nif-specific regulatory protein